MFETETFNRYDNFGALRRFFKPRGGPATASMTHR